MGNAANARELAPVPARAAPSRDLFRQASVLVGGAALFAGW